MLSSKTATVLLLATSSAHGQLVPPSGGPMGTGTIGKAHTTTSFTGAGPWKAPGLGALGFTTVSGAVVGTSSILPVGEDVFGPFEAGFTSQQDFVLSGLGCATGKGYLPGGLDTYTAERIVAQDCGVTLPRWVNGQRIGVLDSCGGHTKEYHLHEHLSCLYSQSGAHSAKVAAGIDGKPLYGKWEDYDNQERPMLDACGGHWGVTPESPDVEVYHYHVQDTAPFTIGCFGPNADGSLVSVAQCRELYSDVCGDDVNSYLTPEGIVNYDLWCPCFDADGSNIGTKELPVITGAPQTSPTAAPATAPPATAPPATAPPATAPPATAPPASTGGGFDFGSGCESGSGSFQQVLPTQGESVDVGVIPAGKFNVRVALTSDSDIDIALYDLESNDQFEEGTAVVAWCGTGNCNAGVLGMEGGTGTATYTRPSDASAGQIVPMVVAYSGYNGEGGNLGHEWIEISGETTAPLLMKAFAYATGQALVEYEWGVSQSDCCLGRGACIGSFQQLIVKDQVVDVGEIPAGVLDLEVSLTADDDVDIQLFDLEALQPFSEGKAIVAWCGSPDCNIGVLNGPGEAETLYHGLTYRYSGYNGVNNQLGAEFIEIDGSTNRKLMMKAYGYEAGMAFVEYSYWESPEAVASRQQAP